MKKTPQQPIVIPGLSEREALIWQTLSNDAHMLVTEIAKYTGLNRPAVYQHLPALIEKGLVSEKRLGGRRYYLTTGPHTLAKFRATQDENLGSHLSLLLQSASLSSQDDVAVFKGKDLSVIWSQILGLPKGSFFYRYDAYSSAKVNVFTYMPKDFYEVLAKKKIERFVICNEGLRKGSYVKRIECASRMLPKSWNLFEQGITQFIFGDSVAMIDFNKEIAFVLKNAALAAFQKQIFLATYRSLKE